MIVQPKSQPTQAKNQGKKGFGRIRLGLRRIEAWVHEKSSIHRKMGDEKPKRLMVDNVQWVE
jgi:hypothetical protein